MNDTQSANGLSKKQDITAQHQKNGPREPNCGIPSHAELD